MSEKWLYAVDIEMAVPLYRCIAWLYSPYTLDYLYIKGYGTCDFPDFCIGVGIFFLLLWLIPAMVSYYRFQRPHTKGMHFWEKFKWEWRFTVVMVKAVFMKRERWESLFFTLRD